MKSAWPEFTIVRFCLALMLGIGLEILCDYTLEQSNYYLVYALCIVAASSLFSIGYYHMSIGTQFRLRYINGLSIIFLITGLGYLVTWAHAEKNDARHFSKFVTDDAIYLVSVEQPPVLKDKTVTFPAQVHHLLLNGKEKHTIGKILLNVVRDSISQSLKYGDEFVFKTKLETFEGPKNPGEFSYKLYQSFHNIYHRAFLKSGDWKLTGANTGNIFFRIVYEWRDRFLHVAQNYVSDINDFGVASAIMLGYRDYVTGDIVRAYSSSGALHVLSVSGLHLATMFFMLNMMLNWMDGRGRKMAISKAMLILALIWIYTCLTGLSPSVLRAAMMFSLIQVGKLTMRRMHMFNILAGSAVILMLFDPFIVTEVGFRLSYLAVLGIVYLHPKISSKWVIVSDRAPAYKKAKWYKKPIVFLRNDVWWFIRYALLDFFWQLTSVSIAAQIATAPLGLYYFHQFPILFFVSNWVVIPVGNLILFSGTLLFMFSWVPYMSHFLGWSFNELIHLLNQFIFLVDAFPYALWDRISILMVEMILIYIVILILCVITEDYSRRWRGRLLLTAMLISTMLIAYNTYERITFPLQQEFVVYHVPKQSAIAIISGRQCQYLFDKEILQNQSAMLFHVNHYIWEKGVQEEQELKGETYQRLPFGKFLQVGGQRIVVVDTAISKGLTDIRNKLKVDVVVLSHNPRLYIAELKKLVDFDKIVFDTSNKSWRTAYWKKDCLQLGIDYWDVAERGAFVNSIL
ncbi:MAG: ComEC family competence protein [Bacteroidetes bacterium]|nr:ComEC family competence protein [Bacteroidota bacterium]